eukprot:TRINITY_DN1300_c0_g1_i1.p1 TRINITY_DN1300_c0_g1~~TRINITY_DN1300_c0_g1_i1.p1  ORF type:complete len:124 (-),score=24.44 TRINITY_DN1300_c0_g1_i1:104-475(-)
MKSVIFLACFCFFLTYVTAQKGVWDPQCRNLAPKRPNSTSACEGSMACCCGSSGCLYLNSTYRCFDQNDWVCCGCKNNLCVACGKEGVCRETDVSFDCVSSAGRAFFSIFALFVGVLLNMLMQ